MKYHHINPSGACTCGYGRARAFYLKTSHAYIIWFRSALYRRARLTISHNQRKRVNAANPPTQPHGPSETRVVIIRHLTGKKAMNIKQINKHTQPRIWGIGLLGFWLGCKKNILFCTIAGGFYSTYTPMWVCMFFKEISSIWWPCVQCV